MATTYFNLTNQVLEDLAFNPTTEAAFSSPAEEEVRLVKRLLNEAKDKVIPRLGNDILERTYHLEFHAPYNKAGYPSLSIWANRTTITAFGATFLQDVEGWKVHFAGIPHVNTNITTASDGLTDDQPHIVTTHHTNTILSVDREWSDENANNVPTDWAVYQDEADLDAKVRQVLWASTSEGPLELRFVERGELDQLSRNTATFGTPRFAYLFRSETAGSIWRVQLVPAPAARIWLTLRASIRFDDLTDADDYWDLEPEIERIIKDECVYQALSTPFKADLDMAALRRADLKERVQDWKASYANPAPNRRSVRRGPDEGPARGVVRRFNIENP